MTTSNSPFQVLIAEDETDQLRLLTGLMRQAGYATTIATDGAQAYAKAVANKPDLILMDVLMPKLSGLAVARRLKQTPETRDTPIIFISCAVTVEDRLAGLRAGGSDYVIKPFHGDEVLERVRIHLELKAGEPSRENPFVAATVAASSEQRALFAAATRLIRDQLREAISPREVAQLLACSERKLSAAFQACAGVSVSGYRRQAMMERAHRLVTQTGLSMDAIADELGYSSAANFSTAFRDYFGNSPSAVRKAS